MWTDKQFAVYFDTEILQSGENEQTRITGDHMDVPTKIMLKETQKGVHSVWFHLH